MKDRFHLPDGIYLLSHSVGCLPRGWEAAVEEGYHRPWRDLGGDAWPVWLAGVARFREGVARLIGARADQVCPQTNVSGAVTKILHALPREAGRDIILLCEEDFPSLGFVAQAMPAMRLRFLPRGEAAQDGETWRRALTPEVHAAIVTHAFSNRSALLPVAEIGRAARAAGVTTIVDAVQTLGVVPVDVGAWPVDYLVGSSVKFLCGGPGAAFLWASDRAAAEARPVDVGWFSHADPFAFDIHDFRPAEGAARFWGGSPSVQPFVQAAHAIGTLLESGVEAIHDHNQALIDRLHDALGKRIRSARDRDGRGNGVLVAVEDAADTLARLRAAGIRLDARDGCIRLSPHIYTDAADCDRLLAHL